MKFKADEIVSVLREELARYRRELDVSHMGRVLEVGDGIAQVFGLSDVMAGEMLQFDGGEMGQVFNVEEDSLGVVVYGDARSVKEGEAVRATGKLLEVPVGGEMLGRVVNPLGQPIDGKGPVSTQQTRPVEIIAPGISARQPVIDPLYTGIKAVDAMTPIGRGQRELIIGDRKTGKTAIALDTILNQRDSGVVCVYVAIGQKDSTVAGVVDTLQRFGAMDHTIVVAASSSDPAPLQYVAPYAGCALAEHFMYTQGRDTLVVYDDLNKQAGAYRQISLLLRRPPGREAYPGDVFYLHSRLLERACRLADKYVVVLQSSKEDQADEGVDGKVYSGPFSRKHAEAALRKMPNADRLEVRRVPTSGGSLTALPICETQEGEVAAYIPTNLISITDGQIYLEPSLFFAGVRPAINAGISVSRVGYKAASAAMKEVAKGLRLDLAAYRELESFAQLGMELDPTAQRQLDRGARMVRLLTQAQYRPMPVADQIIALFAGARGYLDDLKVDEVSEFEEGLIERVKAIRRSFYEAFVSDLKLTPQRVKQLERIIEDYRETAYQEVRRARRQRAAAGGE